jgi:hypothetical protein
MSKRAPHDIGGNVATNGDAARLEARATKKFNNES